MFDRRATAHARRRGRHPWAWARRCTNGALCPLQSPRFWLQNRRVHITNSCDNTATQRTLLSKPKNYSQIDKRPGRLQIGFSRDSLTAFQEFLELLILERGELLTEAQMENDLKEMPSM